MRDKLLRSLKVGVDAAEKEPKAGPKTPREMLTTNNTKTQKQYQPSLVNTHNEKTEKGEGKGYLTGIMHMQPSDLSGYGNVCPSASPQWLMPKRSQEAGSPWPSGSCSTGISDSSARVLVPSRIRFS
jgi:hypothetical protein